MGDTEVKSSKQAKDKQPATDLADGPHCFTDTNGIITTTMNEIPGYRVVCVLGAVYGMTVRSRNWAASMGMAIKSLAGGELQWFTNMLYSARNDAVSRLITETEERGGNAIIAMRFDASDLGGWAQVCAYGTAVIVEKIEDGEEGAQFANSSKA
ncbi:hypothetical protein VTJ04DRAFT_3553 [Mycothermus thermophilus]|uniref:uncharacterized protein n=1 Tax=Humicola insolens TaxID=85995 RepID=UPI0037433B59